MLNVTVFGKETCAKCRSTKKKLRFLLGKWELDHKVAIMFYDLDTVKGMTEGMFHDVDDVPVTIIRDAGQDLARWDGEIPGTEQLEACLRNGVSA